MNNRSGLIT